MVTVNKEIIKQKITELKTVRDILFYLDVCEKEVNDRISELYMKTRMNEVGDFLAGENGWEYFFEYRAFNPEFMTYPPLTKEQQTQYLKNYGIEIKEAEDLHNLDYFIKDQKKFYEKQLVKYAMDIPHTFNYKALWDELVDAYFDTKVLIRQLENIGDDKEDEYIEYCKKKYRHRTKEEWMKYYGRLQMADSVESLKKANLPPELEYTNSIRIANARFEESTLGQFTLQNLHSFEKKYVKKDYIVKLSTGQETINQKLDDVKSNGSQEESNHKIEKKTVPSKGLKNLGKTFCEKLIDQKVITSILTETKSEKAITELIIPEIEKEYILTLANKKSLHDYFRQGHLLIRKDKTGQLIVTDTYKRKNN